MCGSRGGSSGSSLSRGTGAARRPRPVHAGAETAPPARLQPRGPALPEGSSGTGGACGVRRPRSFSSRQDGAPRPQLSAARSAARSAAGAGIRPRGRGVCAARSRFSATSASRKSCWEPRGLPEPLRGAPEAAGPGCSSARLSRAPDARGGSRGYRARSRGRARGTLPVPPPSPSPFRRPPVPQVRGAARDRAGPGASPRSSPGPGAPVGAAGLRCRSAAPSGPGRGGAERGGAVAVAGPRLAPGAAD